MSNFDIIDYLAAADVSFALFYLSEDKKMLSHAIHQNGNTTQLTFSLASRWSIQDPKMVLIGQNEIHFFRVTRRLRVSIALDLQKLYLHYQHPTDRTTLTEQKNPSVSLLWDDASEVSSFSFALYFLI